MKNILICMLYFFTFGSMAIFAAEPYIKIPEKPSKQELEVFESSKELFTLKLMEYYKTALVLKNQIEFLGTIPVKDVPNISIDDFESQEKKILIKYFNIIVDLKTQLDKLPLDPCKERLDTLRKQLINCSNKNIDLEARHFQDSIHILSSNYYKNIFNENIKQIDSLIIYSDKIKADNSNKLKELRNILIEYYENQNTRLEPLISVGFSGNLFLNTGNENIENHPSLGFIASLNTYRLFGWWNGLDIWYEYISPRISSKTTYKADNTKSISMDWNSNIHSCGLSKKFGNFIKSNSLNDGIKIGLGYFWANGNVYNFKGDYTYEGGKLDLEYFAGTVSVNCPLELFIGLSVLHSFSKDLIYYENHYLNPINAGRTHLNAKLGIRFNLNKFPF